ncbi:DUF418 domain-containing protein [Hazenella sp. IB182353]|uniref:DUF418 domain-containing protein n=1 Tax=Polycladospora coralii TaxID=2771432 RepID=UPI0017471C1A|nr:DUF418 domain-containing protein [Polycladospora coralii]MBS7531965.1 DUF418 domain-containing protein [Polycladospora coralii]
MQRKSERIPLIDVLRGFAILGTLGTNIWIFAYLGDLTYLTTSSFSGWWSWDDLIRMFVLFLVNGKLLGLLTIIFGVGLEIKYQEALRKRRVWPGVYLWTVLFLFVEGLIHFIWVMEYDILMSYAVTAVVVAFIVKAGDRAINRALVIVGSWHILMIMLIFVSSWYGASQVDLNMESVSGLYANGTWIEQIQNRLDHFIYYRMEAIFIIPMNIFLFLVGVKLMRHHVFASNKSGFEKRQKLLYLGLFLGLPLNLLTFIPGGLFDIPVRYLFAPLLSLGYIGIWSWLIRFQKWSCLWRRFEDLGKMSLSSYVLQNVCASMIFYGWGIGLGGKLNSLQVITILVMLASLQLWLAPIILERFKMGPLEWIRKRAVRAISQK